MRHRYWGTGIGRRPLCSLIRWYVFYRWCPRLTCWWGQLENECNHCSDVTKTSCHIQSSVNWVLVQQFVQSYNTEIIIALHYWPFVIGIQRWPLDSQHKWSVMRKPLHIMTSPCAVLTQKLSTCGGYHGGVITRLVEFTVARFSVYQIGLGFCNEHKMMYMQTIYIYKWNKEMHMWKKNLSDSERIFSIRTNLCRPIGTKLCYHISTA